MQTAPNSSNMAALPFISTFHTDLTIPGQPRILFSFPFSSQSVVMPSALLINYFLYIISCSSLCRDLSPLRLAVKEVLFHFPCKAIFVALTLMSRPILS